MVYLYLAAWLILAITEVVLVVVFAGPSILLISMIVIAWCGGVAWTLLMQKSNLLKF